MVSPASRFYVVQALLATLVVGASSTPAAADLEKCQRTIAREGAKLVQAEAKILSKCEEAVVQGKPPCDGNAVSDKIGKAKDKLEAAIDKACGGTDQQCGGDMTGEDAPAALGWPAVCPSFEGETEPECNVTLSTCNDIAECLECIGKEAVEQAMDLYYENLILPSADKALKKCQVTIGKESTKFLAAKAKILQKCWDARLTGKHGDACPDPGDGKAVLAIAKADLKKRTAICKACGGPDQLCGGGDDLTPAAIGFAPTCDDVTQPGGPSCSGPIATLDDIVDCVGCVTQFKVDCTDRSQVPQFGAYPSECAGATATPSPTPTATPIPPCGNGTLEVGEDCEPATLDAACPGACAPTGTPDECTCPTGTFTFDAVAGADLDTGWTGISHDQQALVGKVFTANAYGCSSGGPDTMCSFVATYATNFFGPPLPLSSGGVPVCVVNEVVGLADGTLDLVSGDFTYNYALTAHAHTGLVADQPCPTCVGDLVDDDDVKDGTCSGGPSDGDPCDADGSSAFFGKTSFDCLPAAGANIGNLAIVFDEATTGTKTVTTTGSSPNCRAIGVTGDKCFCDTCDDAAGTPCASHADCTAVGATTCGGKRCLPGSAVPGLPCATNADCSPGFCGVPGIATRPNGCSDGVCSAGVGDEGVCLAGPTNQHCVIDTFRSCTLDGDCPALGDTCASDMVECFRPTVTRTGTPGLPGGVYAGEFCIPPTGSSAVNTVAGLPGLGTLLLPYSLGVSIP